MKKKTIIIVAIALIIAIIAIIAIARIPKQKLKQQLSDVKNPVIQSGNIDLQENTKPTGPEVQGEDEYDLNDYNDPVELLPPAIDDGDIFQEVNELQTIAKAGSAVLKAELGAFKGNIEVGLKKLGIFNEEYMRAEVLTKGYATKFAAYKYSATKDGKNYITAGRVKLVFSVPKSYDIDKIAVCYLFEDHVQELDCYVNKKDRTVIVSATAPGVYLLVEEKPVTNKPSNNTSSDSTSSNTNSSNNSTSSMPEGDPESMEGWTPWF
jgi:hypothetical protein